MALAWREEGAQIIGGCCGTRPDHIAAARERLAGTKPGHRRRGGLDDLDAGGNGVAAAGPPAPWADGRDRRLFPLPFPDLAVDPGVQPPGEASFMVWRYLFREGIGAHQRCLDVGCGTGILGVQLALNGAAHVRAIDVDRRAVANTLTNAFRNGVDDRLTATVVDLFPWTAGGALRGRRREPPPAARRPRRRRLDPPRGRLLGPPARRPAHRQALGRARARGRRLRHAALAPLPAAHRRAARRGRLPRRGRRLVDVRPAGADAEDTRTQIARVEELSDAYHLAGRRARRRRRLPARDHGQGATATAARHRRRRGRGPSL